MTAPEARVNRIDVAAYTVPTDLPEADGTFAWRSTTIIIVRASAGGVHGLGYPYGDVAIARLIAGTLAPGLSGHDSMAPTAAWQAMGRATRNVGRLGAASLAISAVDGGACMHVYAPHLGDRCS